ncbi:MAG: hypothetical protein L0Z62_48680 [Gemmataceae bacterium]|nr:hypothetical protein [Gemmataceae bacterium]
MEAITFQCSNCRHTMKVGGDKAGRKARCPKCKAELTIPAASPAASAPSKGSAEDEDAGTYGLIGAFNAPPVEEKPKKRRRDDDDDDEEEDEEEEAARARAAAVPKTPGAPEGFRVTAPRARALLEPERWHKVQLGLMLMSIGLWVWLGGFLLGRVPVIIGAFASPEYAGIALRYAETSGPAKLTRTEFLMTVVTGTDSASAGLWLARISEILLLLAQLTLIAGSALCLPVPSRFGSKGLALTLVILGSVNVILGLVFRLLPHTGAMEYVIIPVAVPEVSMVGFPDRLIPLNLMFASLPVLDYILALMIWGALFVQLILICAFVRTVALAMRNDELESRMQGLIHMGLGVMFALLSYLLISLTGTSEVLQWLLRVVYGLWAGFFVGLLVWYALTLLQVPALIGEELDESETGKSRDKDEDQYEDEDEDD